MFQKVTKGDPVLRSCSNTFCTPHTDQVDIESAGSKAIVSLFNGATSDSLASLRYSFLCKKVVSSSTFVTPERLPPTQSALKYHSFRCYLQVMTWMGLSSQMDAEKWG